MFQKIRQYSDHTFSSLRIRNYRLYFTGQGISLCGTWMQTIAQTWLVLQLTHSGTDIGLLLAVQFLPILILGAFGGVIADRFAKRRLIFITQSSALVLALTLGLLVQFHLVHVWMVFVLSGLLGLVTAVDNPSRQSFMTEIVGREHITNAITLNSIELNLARVIGPSIAGILIANVGISFCFFINSASYVAVLICLFLMNSSELIPNKRITKIRGQLSEGFAYVRATPVLRNMIVMLVIIGMLSFEFPVVLPVFASRTFHGNAASYALLMSAMSFGSVIGGFVVASKKNYTQNTVLVAAIVFGLFMLFSSLSPNIVVATIMLVGVGFGTIIFSALCNSTLQLNSSPEMRGRVMALWGVTFLGTTPIGGPIIGWLSDHSSPRTGLAVGGLAAIIAALIGFYLSHRGTRSTNKTLDTQSA